MRTNVSNLFNGASTAGATTLRQQQQLVLYLQNPGENPVIVGEGDTLSSYISAAYQLDPFLQSRFGSLGGESAYFNYIAQQLGIDPTELSNSQITIGEPLRADVLNSLFDSEFRDRIGTMMIDPEVYPGGAATVGTPSPIEDMEGTSGVVEMPQPVVVNTTEEAIPVAPSFLSTSVTLASLNTVNISNEALDQAFSAAYIADPGAPQLEGLFEGLDLSTVQYLYTVWETLCRQRMRLMPDNALYDSRMDRFKEDPANPNSEIDFVGVTRLLVKQQTAPETLTEPERQNLQYLYGFLENDPSMILDRQLNFTRAAQQHQTYDDSTQQYTNSIPDAGMTEFTYQPGMTLSGLAVMARNLDPTLQNSSSFNDYLAALIAAVNTQRQGQPPLTAQGPLPIDLIGQPIPKAVLEALFSNPAFWQQDFTLLYDVLDERIFLPEDAWEVTTRPERAVEQPVTSLDVVIRNFTPFFEGFMEESLTNAPDMNSYQGTGSDLTTYRQWLEYVRVGESSPELATHHNYRQNILDLVQMLDSYYADESYTARMVDNRYRMPEDWNNSTIGLTHGRL